MTSIVAARDNWMPEQVVNFVVALTPHELATSERSRMFLLAKITGDSTPWMAQATGHTITMRSPTDEAPLIDLATQMHDFRQDPIGMAGMLGHVEGNAEDTKVAEATGHPHFLFPIQKREDGAAFLDKVTVGRTRNHDLVLRDSSVSKYHASLELLPDRTILVRDQDSKNNTLINGVAISKAVASPGDDIQFGSVKAIICTADALWRNLRS